MSRSYRKHPWAVLGDKEYKKIFNRKLRRIKNNKDDYYDFPQNNYYKKANQTYYINDWNWDCSWEIMQHHGVDYPTWKKVYKCK
jgi:hypothetical protein